MGLGGISPTQLLIILAIVALIFGTKKLRSLGSDVGGAVKGFRKAMNEEDGKNSKDGAALTQAKAAETKSENVHDTEKTS